MWKLDWGPVWKLRLGASVKTRLRGQYGNYAWRLVWKPGLGANVETRLRVYWSFIWMKRTINLRNIIETNLGIFFFNFLPSKMKGFDNYSYEWRGFWLKRWKIFYSKRWMTHVCMTWYDVWIFLLHFFENKFELIPISLLFRIHGIIIFFLLFKMISLV